ncbi:uncharacterized protein MAM_01060 [Metarhizium album ARSEF 1941]|uniref:Uncharacterized protein n=1 Tax=Metarhizium album (strain ARSEF 1941) TaxID=1081103 RepID=A0A0B2X6P0_METAS|nr:uncharacterized protein MAM_01060 [Metarhizium album ARSEF 1941]KHO02059.1 hypothetical protein MAM_01060 [Metarhizium album ARSEF 1941]
MLVPAVTVAAIVFLSVTAAASNCPSFPPSVLEYSSEFKQPEPPAVKPEFQTHFIQHKWHVGLIYAPPNHNLSHIQNGYMYHSPTKKLVRVDETFENGLATSMFNFANVTKDGLVDNTLTSVFKDFAHPEIWRGYVNTNYPLISADFLTQAGAVFSGLVERNFVPGKVASWSILYQGLIPVTVYVDGCNAVQGYDYFYPNERTRVTTSFLNTRVGKVDM